MRLVLDASAAVHLVMRTEQAPALADIVADASIVLVPGLFHAEVANALCKYARSGRITREQAVERATEATELIDLAIPDAELVTECLAATIHHDHPVYDLLYAVTARRHACQVLTLDRRLLELLDAMGVPAARAS